MNNSGMPIAILIIVLTVVIFGIALFFTEEEDPRGSASVEVSVPASGSSEQE